MLSITKAEANTQRDPTSTATNDAWRGQLNYAVIACTLRAKNLPYEELSHMEQLQPS